MSGIKAETAPTVQRLLDAGARFAGKTITDELAFSMNGQNAHFGSPLNGAAPDRISGGSSSGSASAVSNHLCDFAVGSDTGGSVRGPANHCGLVGLRPTHGRVSLKGALDLAPSLDTCGWFTRDVPTFARVADVLLGTDPAPLADKVRPARAARRLGPARTRGAGGASRAAGTDRGRARRGDAGRRGVREFRDDVLELSLQQGREAWHTDGALIDRFAPPLGPGVKERFAWAREVTAAQYDESAAFRARFKAHVAALLGSDGVLLMPTMPDVAPLVSADEALLEDYRNQATRMLCIAGLSGFPQLSLPLGNRLGAPLGISLLGPAGSDRSLVRLAEPDHGRRLTGAARRAAHGFG
jgi:amidase